MKKENKPKKRELTSFEERKDEYLNKIDCEARALNIGLLAPNEFFNAIINHTDAFIKSHLQ